MRKSKFINSQIAAILKEVEEACLPRESASI